MMTLVRRICLRLLGIKESPFLRCSLGQDISGKPLFFYAGRNAHDLIMDKFDLWPKGRPLLEKGKCLVK